MQASEALTARTHSRLRRLDLRVAVGLLLMTVAVLGGASLIRTAQARTPALVAAVSAQPGVAYRPASMRGEIEGRVAAEPLWEGKVLAPESVADAPPLAAGTVAITLLLPPESAVGGGVQAGDRVAGLSSPGANEAGAAEKPPDTTTLLTEVPVLSVRQASTAEGEGLLVTLTLRLEEARALAEARATGRLDLALLPGATS